jgi:hypothetical protein
MRGLAVCLIVLLLSMAGCCSQAGHSTPESTSGETECNDCCSMKSRAEMLKKKQQEQKANPQSSPQQ